MNERQASELFKRHRANGDYDAAAAVMLSWAREAGKPHNLWHANMILLLFALKLGMHDEALRRAEELEKIDADDPYLSEMIARIYEAQGRHDEAILSAQKAVKNAEADDPTVSHGYSDYFRQLTDGSGEDHITIP